MDQASQESCHWAGKGASPAAAAPLGWWASSALAAARGLARGAPAKSGAPALFWCCCRGEAGSAESARLAWGNE